MTLTEWLREFICGADNMNNVFRRNITIEQMEDLRISDYASPKHSVIQLWIF